MKLAQILFSQGFGSRHECAGLIALGHVTVQGRVCQDPWEEFDLEGLTFSVCGQRWPYHAKALIMMNKPQGVECSQKPKHHPSVYSLLPAPLRRRNLQSIGRLDEDTTGLLLFTDDGALIHRLTSPKKNVPKIYEVQCKHPVSKEQIERLLAGVQLVDDPATVRAVACEVLNQAPDYPKIDAITSGGSTRSDRVECSLTSDCHLRMTLTDGKYHQVKRMLAAVGNRVERLHRSGFGALSLPLNLAPGQWHWLMLSQVESAALK